MSGSARKKSRRCANLGRVYGPARPYIDRTTHKITPFIRFSQKKKCARCGRILSYSYDRLGLKEAKGICHRIRVVKKQAGKGKVLYLYSLIPHGFILALEFKQCNLTPPFTLQRPVYSHPSHPFPLCISVHRI
ncbi:hypothetical protein N665_2039s0001 [Sinapis alba]|nr:hypothetical protein N665_2039s0001 [Sinapis alba]